jgi:two-component system sensor histidine kinase DegS
MSQPADPAAPAGVPLAARLHEDLATLDRELKEIDMLVGQARVEASRHEQKRAQAADRIQAPDKRTDPKDLADAYTQLVALTRRAVLMESQVEVLEGKRKSLARHRAAVAAIAEALDASIGGPVGTDATAGAANEALPPSLSRVVLNAQEDLRREIARAMHDGPAQSLTNIVLQAQIVERLLERDPSVAKNELGQLVTMVQHTLDATKNFIFDVRPMVLDDLGLVPTLRRAARDRGRRVHVQVEFESLGQDQRLPMEVESTVFRILDEALAAYLGLAPEPCPPLGGHLDGRGAPERPQRGRRPRRDQADDPGSPRRPAGGRGGRRGRRDRRAAPGDPTRRDAAGGLDRRHGGDPGRRRRAAARGAADGC